MSDPRLGDDIMCNMRRRGIHYRPPKKTGDAIDVVAKRRRLRGRLHKIWIEYHGICAICGKKIIPVSDASIDHIVPLCRGGTNKHKNLQLAHASCNNAKGGK